MLSVFSTSIYFFEENWILNKHIQQRKCLESTCQKPNLEQKKKCVQHRLSQIILDLVLLRSLQNMEVVSYSLNDNYYSCKQVNPTFVYLIILNITTMQNPAGIKLKPSDAIHAPSSLAHLAHQCTHNIVHPYLLHTGLQ